MDFFRGDNRGPQDNSILAYGFACKPPSQPMDGPKAYKYLLDELARCKGPNTLGQTWRERTPGNLNASAMTQAGAFQNMKYFYKFTIPDDELTAIEVSDGGKIEGVFSIAEALTRKVYFVLCDNNAVANANLIAFCHGKVNTKEATYLTTIPKKYIVGYRNGHNTTEEHIPFVPFLGPHRRTEPLPGYGVINNLQR